MHWGRGGGPGGSTWLRSRSPVMKASGALAMVGAGEWPGLAVTACVRLLSSQWWGAQSQVCIPEMISQVGGRHRHSDEPLNISSRSWMDDNFECCQLLSSLKLRCAVLVLAICF